MKICMISYSQFEFDNRVHRYAESLCKRGDLVHVISLGAKGQKRVEQLGAVRVHRVMSRSYRESNPLSYLWQMLLFFTLSTLTCGILHLRYRYHVLHFHNIPDFGVFATIIPKLLGARVILDIHDLVPEFYQRKFSLDDNSLMIRILKWVERLACLYADSVITMTNIWRDRIISRSAPAAKVEVILNSPDPNLFFRNGSEQAKWKSKEINLVYHGNLSEIFGVDLAIQALPAIAKKEPRAALHIYGQGGEKENLITMAEKIGIKDRVFFHDPIVRSEIPVMLRKMDIGIDPKRDGILASEGLSSKCMEYLAVGLPSIVSRITAAQAYYMDDQVAFFQPGSSSDLAEKVLDLMTHTAKRASLINHSEDFVQKHHWKRYEERYFHILDSLKHGRIR